MAEIEIGEGGTGGGEPEQANDNPGRDPRINELTTWRKRALDAEREARAAQDELKAQQARAEESAQRLKETETTLEAARTLHQAGVRDLDAGLERVHAARAQAPQRSVREIVSDLRRTDSALFHMRQGVNSAGAEAPRDPLKDLAAEARASGDRRAVLRYLRARRGT